MRWRFRFVVTTVVALATIIVSLDSSSLEKDPGSAWQPARWLVLASILALGFGVFWGYSDAEVERRRVQRRIEMSVLINNIVFPLWHTIVNKVSTSRRARERIGVHVWMVPTWHWTLIPRWLRSMTPRQVRSRLPTPKLWRACQYRLYDDRGPTDIIWRRDVGAIGRCWRKRQAYYFSVSDNWGAIEMNKVTWEQLPTEHQLGLKYSEYLAIRRKYASVLAAPIFRNPNNVPDSEFIGCLVVDTPAESVININVDPVRGLLATAARDIARNLSGTP